MLVLEAVQFALQSSLTSFQTMVGDYFYTNFPFLYELLTDKENSTQIFLSFFVTATVLLVNSFFFSAAFVNETTPQHMRSSRNSNNRVLHHNSSSSNSEESPSFLVSENGTYQTLVVNGTSTSTSPRDNLQLHLPPLERRIDNLRRWGIDQSRGRNITTTTMPRSSSTESILNNFLRNENSTGFNAINSSNTQEVSTLNAQTHHQDMVTDTNMTSNYHNIAQSPSSSLNQGTILSSTQQNRPKWEILQLLNNIVVGVFSASVTFTITNYRKYFAIDEMKGGSQISLFPFIVLWVICLIYFFGFFGISFLDPKDKVIGSGLLRTPASNYSTNNKATTEGKEIETCDSRNEDNKKEKTINASLNGEVVPPRPKPMNLRNATTTSTKATFTSTSLSSTSTSTSTFTSTSSSSRAVETTTKEIEREAPQKMTQQKLDLKLESMSDDDILMHLGKAQIKDHELESKLKDCLRATKIRRSNLEMKSGVCLENLPLENYDYERIYGANCEAVIGYLTVPVGVVGPLLLDGVKYNVPFATTEGCLVASTTRGCKAIMMGGGASSTILRDGMTRAPLLRLPSAMEAARMKKMVENETYFNELKEAFESTTSFGKLLKITSTIAGRNIFLRFVCKTGDAMGMNMISKGCLKVIEKMEESFPEMELISISGNLCTDKKPAAVNWIEGRGKSVVVEATIPESVVKSVLKTSIKAIVEVNKQKNLVGSAMAGSVGGFNAHAANLVSAIFLATGQDIAQNVESSNCITLLEPITIEKEERISKNHHLEGDENQGEKRVTIVEEEALHISVTMPSIEVGTVGGGTSLPAQAACLDLIGVKGASKSPLQPGDNAQQLAKVVAGTVMAGELSLLAALAANHLVRSHMQHNRKKTNEQPKAPKLEQKVEKCQPPMPVTNNTDSQTKTLAE